MRGETGLRRAWLWFLAWTRLSAWAVCEMSAERGVYDDFHDYPDARDGERYPMHGHTYNCRRCGKEFCI